LDDADPADWLDAPDAALAEAIEATPKLIWAVATNKAPALLDVREPSEEQLCRATTIAEAPEFRRRVGAAMAARFVEDPDAPPKPVERQIYGEFYSNADKQLLQEFQHAPWPRRQEIVASLSDPRLHQLGRRLVAFESPELLSTEEMVLFNGYLRDKWSAPEGPETEWMTIAKAQAAIDDMRAKEATDPRELDVIAAFVKQWVSQAL
jgi:exodeoxyribonuclease-1